MIKVAAAGLEAVQVGAGVEGAGGGAHFPAFLAFALLGVGEAGFE